MLQRWLRGWNIFPVGKERLSESRDSSGGGVSRGLLSILLLHRGVKEMKPYFWVISSNRKSSNKHKAKYRNIRLNVRKSFFTGGVVKHYCRLPRKTLESPSLEVLTTQLESNKWPASADPALSKGFEIYDLSNPMSLWFLNPAIVFVYLRETQNVKSFTHLPLLGHVINFRKEVITETKALH